MVIFIFCWGGKREKYRVGLLPLVASHEKTLLALEKSCSEKEKKKGRSSSDKRKKESGVAAGELKVRRDSSERQALQTPAAAPSLSAAGGASGWKRGCRCSLQ